MRRAAGFSSSVEVVAAAVALMRMESSEFNSGDDIRVVARERKGVQSLGLADVCRMEEKTTFVTDGRVSPRKLRGVAAMDHVSVC
jgi:hypothetical protein